MILVGFLVLVVFLVLGTLRVSLSLRLFMALSAMGLYSFPIIPGATLKKFAFLGLFLGYVVSALLSEGALRLHRELVKRMAFLVVFLILGTMNAPDSLAALGSTVEILLALIGGVIFASAIRSPDDLRGILKATVVGAVPSTLVGLGQFPGVPFLTRFAGWTVADPEEGWWLFRACGPFSNPNALGNLDAIALLILFASLQQPARPGTRLGQAAVGLLLALGIYYSGSRSALVLLFFGIVVWTLYRHRVALSRAQRAAVFAALLCVPLAFFLRSRGQPDESGTALARITEVDTSVAIRFVLTQKALHLFRIHPFVGIGAGSFQRITVSGIDSALTVGKVSHSLYLTALVEAGVAGFVVMLSVTIVAIRLAFGAHRRLHAAGLADPYFLALAMVMTSSALFRYSTHGSIGADEMWMLFGLCFGAASVAVRATLEPAPPPPVTS